MVAGADGGMIDTLVSYPLPDIARVVNLLVFAILLLAAVLAFEAWPAKPKRRK